MKVLVCAASKYGATSEIAQAAADVLASRACEITVLPPEKAGAVEEFDAVVLGSAVYMGQWMKPARELANDPLARWPRGRSGCFQRPGRRTPGSAATAAAAPPCLYPPACPQAFPAIPPGELNGEARRSPPRPGPAVAGGPPRSVRSRRRVTGRCSCAR
jgi:hypothetical protein